MSLATQVVRESSEVIVSSRATALVVIAKALRSHSGVPVALSSRTAWLT